MHKGSVLSTSSPTFVICVLFDDSHSERCKVTYLIVVLVCISLMIIDVKHLFICLLAICISSGKTSIHFFCPFLNWLVCFFDVELYELFKNLILIEVNVFVDFLLKKFILAVLLSTAHHTELLHSVGAYFLFCGDSILVYNKNLFLPGGII